MDYQGPFWFDWFEDHKTSDECVSIKVSIQIVFQGNGGMLLMRGFKYSQETIIKVKSQYWCSFSITGLQNLRNEAYSDFICH